MDVKELKEIPFFFVVGTARSGTTMLRQIIDSNPNTIFPVESKLIIHLQKMYLNETTWTPEKINRLLDDLYKERNFKQFWNIDRKIIKDKIAEIPLDELTFTLICKIVYLCFNSLYPKEKISLIGDKNPVFAIFVDLLLKIFPEAKFIHIVRDYRPNSLSNSLAFQKNDLPFFSAQWKLYNELIEKQKKIFPNNFYTVRYEDLVSKPEKYVKEICAFIGIEYFPSMLDFHLLTSKTYKDKNIEGFERFHTGWQNPINTNKIDAWRQKLTKDQIGIIEYISGGLGEKYGYEKLNSSKHFSFFFQSMKAKFKCKKNYFIIRMYYTMPVFMRRSITALTVGLYRLVKFKHAYNKHDIDIVEGKRDFQ